jgi:hypothetical protein
MNYHSQQPERPKTNGHVQSPISHAAMRAAAPIGQLQLALSYAEIGIPVFPVSWRDKSPLTKRGFKDATTDVAQIRTWWNRHPEALAAIPTGAGTGILVLDIDPGGEVWVQEFFAQNAIETEDDFTSTWVITPRGGRHYYFAYDEGLSIPARAGDIAPAVDVRGEGGYIIAPGNTSPDGRAYRYGGTGRLPDLPSPSRRLAYKMTFNARERLTIKENSDLCEMMRDAEPYQWRPALETCRQARTREIAERTKHLPHDAVGMRAQSLHDLAIAAAEFAGMQDGRRTGMFRKACSVGKYVAHGIITEPEYESAFMVAAESNGALADNGRNWARKTLRSALMKSVNDPLPPLAAEFRTAAA